MRIISLSNTPTRQRGRFKVNAAASALFDSIIDIHRASPIFGSRHLSDPTCGR